MDPENKRPQENEKGAIRQTAEEAAKGAAEKGVRAGLKKAGKWAATKLGIGAAKATAEAVVTGTEVAAAGTGVGLAVAAVIELGKRLVGLVKNAVLGFLRAITGEKDTRKQVAIIAGGATLAFLALGMPIPAGFAGLTAVGAGAATLGGKAIGSGVSGFFQSAIYAITAVTLPAIGIPVLIALVTIPFVVALILFIINSGAYITPQNTNLVAGVVESPYIGIEKTADPEGPFDNSSLPLTITYTITITAKRGSLTNISFSDNCTVIKEGSSPNCPSPSPAIPAPPSIISPVEDYTFSYTARYTSPSFRDTLVIDAFTVTADTDEVTGTEAVGSASIKIGNPPDQCPQGWPLAGRLTQGAYTSSTHRGAEAIDIAVGMGTAITARHSGIARVLDFDGATYGKHVEIISTCPDSPFFSRYAHLSVLMVRTGDPITMGQVIGLSGSTGNSTGPHLHYEFRNEPSAPKSYPGNPPYMMPPYVNKPLPRGCVGYDTCGYVNIP